MATDPNSDGGNVDAGTGDKGQSVVNPDGTFTDNWTDGFEGDLKGNPNLTKYKSLGDLSKSHVSVQKLVGANKVAIPKEDGDWGEFYKAAGRPDSPDGYEYNYPEGVDKIAVGLSDDKMNLWKGRFHVLGLNSRQVKGVLDDFLIDAQQELTESDTQYESSKEEAKAQLRKDWGDDYDPNLARVNHLIDLFEGSNAIDAAGLANNPAMARFLNRMAGAISEKGLRGGDGGDGGGSIQPQIDALWAKSNELMKEPYRNRGAIQSIQQQLTALYKKQNTATQPL